MGDEADYRINRALDQMERFFHRRDIDHAREIIGRINRGQLRREELVDLLPDLGEDEDARADP